MGLFQSSRPKTAVNDEDFYPGVSYTSKSAVPVMKKQEARASRFIVIAAILHFPIIAWVLLNFVPLSPETRELLTSIVSQKGGLTIYATYFVVLAAYLTGKTAEAAGSPFWPACILGIFPPLLPMAWARIARVHPLRPYLMMIVTAVVGAFGWFFLSEKTAWLLVFICAMTPFVIHQLLGGALGRVAENLDFPPSIVLLWICLGPVALFGVYLGEGAPDSWTEMTKLLAALVKHHTIPKLSLDYFEGLFFAPSMITLYVIATWGLWMDNLYHNIKMPHYMEEIDHDSAMQRQKDDLPLVGIGRD